MRSSYNPNEIEKKWREIWPKERESYTLKPGATPYYCLDMFSYPSGEGLHMGHWRPYTIADTWARYQTLLGKQVLHPVGFDAFGLPAENAAIKTQTHPGEYTQKSIATFRRQLEDVGAMYDWSTLTITSDPAYYRWTQWLFLQLYKNGLAYRKSSLVNWCPNCQTVLANEQVISGRCDRCDTLVIKKELKQWFLKITDFAEELLNFDGLNWPERVKASQTNWIGKSEGAEIDFKLAESDETITVFTTRPDTLYGVTYLVVAPEHKLIATLASGTQAQAVSSYVEAALAQSEIDRLAEDRPKTGVFTGSYAVHPLTNELVPLWVADYVIGSYGTGAVMAVPGHDERDYRFAITNDLPIKNVIEPVTGEPQENPEYRQSIVALVRDPNTDTYLTINWSGLGGTLLIGGGRNESEDPIACAMREVTEETGYTDLKFMGQTEVIHHHYYAHSKQAARYIDAIGVYFELQSDASLPLQHEPDEKNKFTFNWISADELKQKITDPLHTYVFEKFAYNKIFTGEGIIANSDEFNGLSSSQAIDAIVARLSEKGLGRKTVTYRLRDWLVSRQRYWGAPIPIVYCESCGEQPVSEDQLPVLLPVDAEFMPTGGSPLERHESFKRAACPKCGGEALRETDTLDTFVDSSWYFLRYTGPQNAQEPFSFEQIKTWLPVDFYVGGVEHSILHLLYSRFIMKALHKLSFVPYHEPFQTFFGNGMVYLNGKKMSKSKGNIVNPDDMVKQYGTDALRGYILFMGPADQDVEWQVNGITGVRRFLDRSWMQFMSVTSESGQIRPAIAKAVTQIKELLDQHVFNRCISALMIASNDIDSPLNRSEAEILVQLYAPFFPHFSEEIWSMLGHTSSIFESSWPESTGYIDATVTYAVQVGGKTRATFEADSGDEESAVIAKAKEIPAILAFLDGKTIVKTVFVSGRIVNFVVK